MRISSWLAQHLAALRALVVLTVLTGLAYPAAIYPSLRSLNIMGLHSPTSAILSAVIFNALVIVALIPLALRGVRYTPSSAVAMLRRNLLIYGLGGIIIPFLGIKIIDLLIQSIPGIS